MLKHLIIVGGGHAGTSAAISAARARSLFTKQEELRITLINSTPYLGIRPRYYEYELEKTQILLTSLMSPINVEVINATVVAIDFDNKSLQYCIQDITSSCQFDSLILTAGSEIKQPNISGIQQYSHNIDSYSTALKFRTALTNHIQQQNSNANCKVAILGGGLTGIELACELPVTVDKICKSHNVMNMKVDISLLDRNKTVLNLGENPQPHIIEALKLAGVQCINHANVTEITANSVIYNKEQELKADLIVSTLGLRANKLTEKLDLSKDSLGRLHTTPYLQISNYPYCFAAGDIALSKVDAEHDSVMSCQHARPQGRYAGNNAVALLYNEELLPYSQPNYVTCVDLGAYGAVYTEGWQRQVKFSGQQAKTMKQHINCDRIYPPLITDQTTLLEAGDPQFIPPK